MSVNTSQAKSFYELAESLPPGTNLSELRQELELRLETDLASMTIPERQLLDGLRLREECLPHPFYAKAEAMDPDWWIDLKGSALAKLADPRKTEKSTCTPNRGKPQTMKRATHPTPTLPVSPASLSSNVTLSAEQLARLQQRKRELSDYARMAFAAKK